MLIKIKLNEFIINDLKEIKENYNQLCIYYDTAMRRFHQIRLHNSIEKLLQDFGLKYCNYFEFSCDDNYIDILIPLKPMDSMVFKVVKIRLDMSTTITNTLNLTIREKRLDF